MSSYILVTNEDFHRLFRLLNKRRNGQKSITAEIAYFEPDNCVQEAEQIRNIVPTWLMVTNRAELLEILLYRNQFATRT